MLGWKCENGGHRRLPEVPSTQNYKQLAEQPAGGHVKLIIWVL